MGGEVKLAIAVNASTSISIAHTPRGAIQLGWTGGSGISSARTNYDCVEVFETAYVSFCGVEKRNTVNAESNRSAFEPTPFPQTTCDVFRLPVTL